MVRRCVPGFLAIEQQLAAWLQQTFGTVVELFYAHGLRQGPATLKSTGFDVHQVRHAGVTPPQSAGTGRNIATRFRGAR